jgi:hypothetical protein
LYTFIISHFTCLKISCKRISVTLIENLADPFYLTYH